MGSDLKSFADCLKPFLFQSTLPGWGATGNADMAPHHIAYFNPRSPDGERQALPPLIPAPQPISIHAPRMGSDRVGACLRQPTRYFNPRSPDGERPGHAAAGGSALGISIHAPRMGSDRENGHLRPRYGQNHPFSTLIVSQIVVDVLGTVRKSQKHQRTSHYEVIKQPERQK